MSNLLIIDTNSVMARAWCVTKAQGMNPYQLRVFLAMFNKAQKLYQPDMILCAFDCKGSKNSRKELDTDYKGTRAPIEEDYIIYGESIRRYLDDVGVTWKWQENYEADDICGCWAEKYKTEYDHIDILTGDYDLLQLADTNVTVHIMRKGLSEVSDFPGGSLIPKYKVTTDNVVLYKTLTGDLSDNIQGVVGPATAVKLIEQYKTLDNILEHVDELKPSVKKKLTESIDKLSVNYELVTIRRDWKLMESSLG